MQPWEKASHWSRKYFLVLSVLHPFLEDLVFQVIAICAALAVVPTAILLVSFIHREEHGFWEHCKIYTCWKFENHSFPLCLVTYKQHIIYTNLENSSGEKWLMKRMGSPPCYNAKASKCHDVTIFSWPTITSHIIMTSVFHCFSIRWSCYISMAVSIFERRQNMATLERTVFCRENN